MYHTCGAHIANFQTLSKASGPKRNPVQDICEIVCPVKTQDPENQTLFSGTYVRLIILRVTLVLQSGTSFIAIAWRTCDLGNICDSKTNAQSISYESKKWKTIKITSNQIQPNIGKHSSRNAPPSLLEEGALRDDIRNFLKTGSRVDVSEYYA